MKHQRRRTSPSNARRSGFTMLELVLAAALGAVVIITVLGVFVQIERTEVLLARRTKDANDLSNLRLVLERALSNFVMSTDPLPAREQTGDGNSAGSRFGATRNARDPNAPMPVPRLICETDPAMAGATMIRLGGGDWAPDSTRVQRVEVVVADSPVPEDERDIFLRAGSREALLGARKAYVRGDLTKRRKDADRAGRTNENPSSDPRNPQDEKAATPDKNADKTPPEGEGEESDGEVAPVRAVRGAFELRPQQPTPAQIREAESNGVEPPRAWEMWWVPLPPRANGSSAPSAEDLLSRGDAFVIASNLRYVQWTLFDDNERKNSLSATWEQQLPAYIEVAVETTSGLNANWMFEVDWGRGPEVPPPPVDLGPKKAEPVDGSGGKSSTPTPRRPSPIPRSAPKEGK
ncbi:MAG: prepilin-type N-terminal cleavage/methylation domain-containing protein [Planctomycetota bacterium]|nr:prepilin-type N-terminal cleavage/methylation domain-containing protein [Planctomycetota bacterium]